MTGRKAIFDEWPEKYDQWFTTPIGTLVKRYESELIRELLQPASGEMILDAGCGTGVFTQDILSAGSQITGLDISFPMLRRGKEKAGGFPFHPVVGDISNLPFRAGSFDKVLSITAIEFVQDARRVVAEFFRVTKKGGVIVVANLNSLSPWAVRRKEKTKKEKTIFQNAVFRSPDELCSLAPVAGVVKTAIHFQKDDMPDRAVETEHEGQNKELQTGAFAVVQWHKP